MCDELIDVVGWLVGCMVRLPTLDVGALVATNVGVEGGTVGEGVAIAGVAVGVIVGGAAGAGATVEPGDGVGASVGPGDGVAVGVNVL